jgi:hypothetical protein
MDWKLLLIGAVMTVAGGFVMWRFRNAGKSKDFGPGCLMSFGIILTLTGVLAFAVGLLTHGS